ncbi:DUF2637 domain-containing protein [Sphaerimonospora mesophila]|uniref:DUF2637 domain-containing protein n=1 Tax=Sphaerimonospora mesophila TaxID=37483 RepID=UPI0006E34137
MNATPPAQGHRGADSRGHGVASTSERRTAAAGNRAAARSASRPSRSVDAPLALRRTAIGLAALALALLAGAACALSFEDLRQLALAGNADPQLAYLYPAAFDILLIVALVCVPLLRGVRLLVRLQAGFILILLLATATATAVATAAGTTLEPRPAAIVVALFPWVMLVLGLWLLLLLLKHARTNRADLDDDDDGDDDEDEDAAEDGHAEDFLPFDRERSAARPGPAPSATEPRPASAGPAATATAPTTPPTPADHGETDLTPHVAADPAPDTGDPAEAHDDIRTPETEGTDSGETETEVPAPEAPTAEPPSVAALPPRPEPAQAAEAPRDRPLRWGDLVRPHAGDVLVHPRRRDTGETPTGSGPVHTPAAAEAAATEPTSEDTPASGPLAAPVPDHMSAPDAQVDESGVDTQPLRHITGVPDPARDREAADPEERSADDDAHDGAATENGETDDGERGDVPLAPPSGRMRSTPLPPK